MEVLEENNFKTLRKFLSKVFLHYMFFRFFFLDSFPFDTGKIDFRSNMFQEGGNDVPLGSAPGKTDMHGLIMGSSKDICSLFDSYLPNHEASTHVITWRMFST